MCKKPDREYQHRLDGNAVAHLIALACSDAPEGYERWSLRLLQDRFVRLEIVDSVSHGTIRTTLKKTNFNLGRRKNTAFRRKPYRRLPATWKTFWMYIPDCMIRNHLKCTWMKPASSCWLTCWNPFQAN